MHVGSHSKTNIKTRKFHNHTKNRRKSKTNNCHFIHTLQLKCNISSFSCLVFFVSFYLTIYNKKSLMNSASSLSYLFVKTFFAMPMCNYSTFTIIIYVNFCSRLFVPFLLLFVIFMHCFCLLMYILVHFIYNSKQQTLILRLSYKTRRLDLSLVY